MKEWGAACLHRDPWPPEPGALQPPSQAGPPWYSTRGPRVSCGQEWRHSATQVLAVARPQAQNAAPRLPQSGVKSSTRLM